MPAGGHVRIGWRPFFWLVALLGLTACQADTAGSGRATVGEALWESFGLILKLDPDLWDIVLLSLFVTGSALLVAGLLGVPAGAWLGLRDFPGRRWLTAAIYTGMGFPPVVIGLLVYLLLSRQGVLGDWGWLFTPKAMILAQIVLALPLVTGVTMGAVRGVSRELQPQLRALGATSRQITWTILREARFGVILGLVAGFGGAISEVGAVMLVGGNIDGQTRVLTTAIVLETRRGNFGLALALGIILMLIAFLANLVAVRLQIGSE
ncbi:MAG: ABC transporter permease [Ardenticatenales bacterium]|nr:ABC transporter permease [Ardenticatenales bacterium]